MLIVTSKVPALSTDSSLTNNKTRNYSIKKLSVLLADPPFSGHVYLDNWINLKEKTLERELSCDPILYYLKQQGIQQWDIVLLEYFLSHSLTCLATYSNVRTVAVYDRITYNYPLWPHPELLSGKTDNLNFVGRLKSTLMYSLPVVSLFELFGSTITTDMCKKTFIGHNLNVGSFLSL